MRREAGTEGGKDGEECGVSGVQDTGWGTEKKGRQTDGQRPRATPRAATNSTRNGATACDYRRGNPATEPPILLGRAGLGPRDAATANANLHLRKDKQGNGPQQQQQHKQINATNSASRSR